MNAVIHGPAPGWAEVPAPTPRPGETHARTSAPETSRIAAILRGFMHANAPICPKRASPASYPDQDLEGLAFVHRRVAVGHATQIDRHVEDRRGVERSP